jgi:hypothetical protein
MPLLGVSIEEPAAALTQGEAVVWRARIVGGQAPFAVAWDFGGGAEPNTVQHSAQAAAGAVASTASVAMQEGSWTVTVTITDAYGVPATDSYAYTVGAEPGLAVAAAYTPGRVTVSAGGPLERALSVEASGPAAFVFGEPEYKLINGGRGALVPVYAQDPLVGASGQVSVVASDSPSRVGRTYLQVNIPPLTLGDDTLYAIPLRQQARVDEHVKLLIAQGVPAQPFQYMVGVGVTVAAAATFYDQSLDYGSPDSWPDSASAQPLDGVWAAMDPSGGFLLRPDFFWVPTDIGGGLERWDFNATPLGGRNLSGAEARGALVNIEFSFDAPGSYTFGFQQTAGVKRTYYADNLNEYYWGDISNSHSGIPNSVVIYE